MYKLTHTPTLGTIHVLECCIVAEGLSGSKPSCEFLFVNASTNLFPCPLLQVHVRLRVNMFCPCDNYYHWDK